jgi:hypothetical protein
MNYLLWPVGARPESQPVLELHNADAVLFDGAPAVRGIFTSSLDGSDIEGIFPLCPLADREMGPYVAVPWVNTRTRVAA